MTVLVRTCKQQEIILPGVMTPQLSQVFGYFLGDGNFEKQGLRFKDERIEILHFCKGLFNQIFNIDGKIRKIKGKNCYDLSINSKEIRDFFEVIILDIFDYIGRSRDDVVRAFIKGFIDAEGSIDKKRAMIIVAQKEKMILRYLQQFLLRFGIRSTIKFDIGKKKINVLRVERRDVLDYLKIGFTAFDKQKELLNRIECYKRTFKKEIMPIKRKDIWDLMKQIGLSPSHFMKPRPECYKWINREELERAFNVLMKRKIRDRQIKQKINFIFLLLNGDVRFEKIRDIQQNKNNGKLFYDFSVPEKENYVANGFIVHNSTFRMYLRRGKKDSRVAKLIDSPNLPDNETVFFITKDGLKDEVV